MEQGRGGAAPKSELERLERIDPDVDEAGRGDQSLESFVNHSSHQGLSIIEDTRGDVVLLCFVYLFVSY